MFDGVSGWGYGAIVLLATLAFARLADRLFAVDSTPGRNVAIDGLRGYLAVGVFLHHAVIHHAFAREGRWALPPPGPYRELGWNCVGLFFMITAFLFVGKLLDARTRRRRIDWLALFASRLLRLAPLYLLAVALLFFFVGMSTRWQLRESPAALLSHAGSWLGFTMTGDPDINRVPMTSILIAGVTWSLAYEWLFYLSLPFLAVALRVRAPLAWVAGCSLLLLVLIANKPGAFFPLAFAKGAFAAWLARREGIAAVLRRPVFAPVIFGAAWVALFAAPTPWTSLWLAAAFCLVACGNTAWGVLSSRAAVVLGDLSYGVYLLHGLMLAWVFLLVFGPERAALLTPTGHWAVVAAIGVTVVAASAWTHRFIEMPAMRRVPRVVAAIRSLRRPPPVVPSRFA